MSELPHVPKEYLDTMPTLEKMQACAKAIERFLRSDEFQALDFSNGEVLYATTLILCSICETVPQPFGPSDAIISFWHKYVLPGGPAGMPA